MEQSAAGGMHGFPAALTSFIGRAAAVGELAGLLDESRLVTVTGPGGSGKTRLAAEVARRMAGQFADGVWLAELASVQDPALASASVAAALDVREQAGESAASALARVLARQQVMLVLDNCEHVIDAAAGLSAGLLAACDDVKILATSREPLQVAGESRYRLGPLSLPDPDGAAEGSEAVALFADRARRADARFALDDGNRRVAARLVARLDGMPLAIELAAARVEALGVAQLLDRIDDRLELLAGGDRRAAGRHRSLAGTVEWSYQLLSERERRVFRLVSVFPGPFTLEAAEAVAGAGTGPMVLRLVDCSLLSPPQAGADGRSRYVMLETLRAYGARLLDEAGELDEAGARLAGYVLRMAEEAAAGLHTTTGELEAARGLDAEDATTRQVLAWAMEHDAATALPLAVALGRWWFLRGRLAGQSPLLREAASHAAVGSEGWCGAQFWLGWTAVYSADLAGALDIFTALRDAVEAGGPSRALADGLAGMSMVLANTGRADEAADAGRRSLAVAREAGYPLGEALALVALSYAAKVADDLSGSLRLARQAGQIPGVIPGWIARVCSSCLTEALTVTGDLPAAERVCAAALARSREVGDLWTLATLLDQMARLDLRAGRLGDAAAHLREELQITVLAGGGLDLLNALEACGHLCAADRRYADAVTLWAAFAALSEPGGFTDISVDVRQRDEPLRHARQAIGPARTRAAEERGAAMGLATAAEYALMLTAPTPTSVSGALSARERELVTLVAQGRTDAQIAAQLYISIRTVRSHLDRIRDKTGCRRRADLTRLALSEGLV